LYARTRRYSRPADDHQRPLPHHRGVQERHHRPRDRAPPHQTTTRWTFTNRSRTAGSPRPAAPATTGSPPSPPGASSPPQTDATTSPSAASQPAGPPPTRPPVAADRRGSDVGVPPQVLDALDQDQQQLAALMAEQGWGATVAVVSRLARDGSGRQPPGAVRLRGPQPVPAGRGAGGSRDRLSGSRAGRGTSAPSASSNRRRR
jgi:hypothetical protein